MAIRQRLPYWPPLRGTRVLSGVFSSWHGRCLSPCEPCVCLPLLEFMPMSERLTLPVLPLREVVLFPGVSTPVGAGRPATLRAIEAALKSDSRLIFAVAQRENVDTVTPDVLYTTGTIAKISQIQRGLGGVQLLLHGERRGTALHYRDNGRYLEAVVHEVDDMPPLNAEDTAFVGLHREARERAAELGQKSGLPEDVVRQVLEEVTDPGRLADLVAGYLEIQPAERQGLLETLSVEDRLRRVLIHVQRQIGVLDAQEHIKSQVQEELGERQREMFLREQMKAIQKELGEGDEGTEVEDLRKRFEALELPEAARKEVDRELARLERASRDSMEAQVIRTYLETMAELPWNKRAEESLDLKRAAEILETIVILLEDLRRPLQVERLLRPLVPGQFGHRLEVRADYLGLHRVPVRPLQPSELAVDFLARGFGELERLEPLPQVLDLGPFVPFAELLLDRLHLLPQEHLALALAQLFLDLGLNVLLGVEHADLPLDMNEDASQPLFHRQRLEQPLALRRLDLEVARHQIREAAGVAHLFEHLTDDVFGETRLLPQLRGPLTRFTVQGDERRIRGVQRRQVVDLVDHGLEVTPVIRKVEGRTPALAVQQQLHAAEAALDLADLGDRPGRVQHVGSDRIDVLALRHGKNEAGVALQRRLDGTQRRGASGAHRGRDTRKQHDLPKRKHGERQSFRHGHELG